MVPLVKFVVFLVGSISYCSIVLATSGDIMVPFRKPDSLFSDDTTYRDKRLQLSMIAHPFFEKIAALSVTYLKSNRVLEQQNLTEYAKYIDGRQLNVTGLLVHIDDNSKNNRNDESSKCNITIHPQNLPRHGHWIALIERGECYFDQKVRFIYQLMNPPVGVVLFNHHHESDYLKMEPLRNDSENFFADFMQHPIIFLISFQEI